MLYPSCASFIGNHILVMPKCISLCLPSLISQVFVSATPLIKATCVLIDKSEQCVWISMFYKGHEDPANGDVLERVRRRELQQESSS